MFRTILDLRARDPYSVEALAVPLLLLFLPSPYHVAVIPNATFGMLGTRLFSDFQTYSVNHITNITNNTRKHPYFFVCA